MKLKYREVKPLREKMLEEQNFKCALCGELIQPGEDVLDHEHSNGKIRSVLHRGCNSLLGKIQNNLTINRISKDRLRVILDNTWTYIYEHPNKDDVLHPTYKEPAAKRNNNGNKSNSTKPKTSSSKNTSKGTTEV